MPRSSTSLSRSLQKRFLALESSRKSIESLVAHGDLSERTAKHLYEGLFLNAHVAFEGFLEDLFIGLLVEGQGVTSSRSDIVARVTIRSHRVARDLV